jgi:hypothetical protein
MIQKRTAIILAIVLVFFFVFVFPFILLQWRASNSQAFCRNVADLPRTELAAFAIRCGDLYTNSYLKGSPDMYNSVKITNRETLNQFVLVGEVPVRIDIWQGFVNIECFSAGHAGAAIQWMDCSQWGEPTWRLESHTFIGRLELYDPTKSVR